MPGAALGTFSRNVQGRELIFTRAQHHESSEMIPRWTLILLLAVIVAAMPASAKKFRPFNEKLMIPKKRFPTTKSPTLTTSTTSTTTAEPERHFDERQFRCAHGSNDIYCNKPILSVEGLLLEAIDGIGLEVCLSVFAQTVIQGGWRNGTLTRDEMEDLELLKQTCRNVSFHPVPTLYKVKNSKQEPIVSNNTTDDYTINLVPVQGRPKAANDPELLNKYNEALKDRSAECKPRKMPIEIPPELHVTWIPKCTLMERCGGCCKHDTMKCVPAEKNGISIVKKKVVAMDSIVKQVRIRQVDIEKHNKCTCVCKVQKSDCNEFQEYESKNCRCTCKNKNTQCQPPLYWDERSCKCRCPDQTITECSTGSYFASHLCRCVTTDEIIEDESKRSRRKL